MEHTLAAMERTLGPAALHTLRNCSSLAAAYQAAGRTAEAIALYERAIADMERTLGPDHADTVRNRNNLATMKRAQAGD